MVKIDGISMNYPLIAVRSHYMINYMVIIRLIIIVTTYYITFAKQHKTETERLRRWGSVWGSVGGVLAKHPPRWNAFVERRSRQLGGVLAYSRQNAAQSANLWLVNNDITVRQQRHYGSSATTLLLVDNGHTFQYFCDRQLESATLIKCIKNQELLRIWITR